MKIIRSLALGVAALAICGIGAPRLAAALDVVMTSELAPTHWKARQMDRLGADIEKRSNGRIKAKIFHAGTLYKDKDALAALSTGAVNLVMPVSNWLESVNAATGILNVPFLLTDPMLKNDTVRNEITALVSSLIESKGLVLLGLSRATEAIYVGRTPIKTMADMKSKKIRVPSGRINHQLVEAYGSTPVTMATSEVATAIAQGAVDAVVTSPGGWQSFGSVAKHATIVPGQQILTYSLVADKNWIAGLAPADREVILGAISAAMSSLITEALTEDQKALDDMLAKGNTVLRLDAREAAEFARRSKVVVEEFRKAFPDVMARFEAAAAKLPK